jgi:amino acid transporter
MCVACSTPLPVGSRFCPRCGAQQPVGAASDAGGGTLLPGPPPSPGYEAPPTAYAPPGYPATPGGYAVAPPAGTNGFAIASFVLSFFFCLYGIGAILAVVFGHIARSQIRRTGQQGAGLALAGMIIGYVGIGLWVLFVVLAIAAGDDTNTGY